MRTLMYHDIAGHDAREAVGFQGQLAARYKLTPSDFDAHLDAVAATGLEVRPLDAGEPAPAVAITFDDGGASAPLAAEALERHGWRGQFFVTSSRVDTPGFMSSEQVRELAARGHLIGSHSHSHPTYMGKLTRAELDEEWTRSRALLGELLGSPPRTASVPGGFLSAEVIASAGAAGYELLFTSEPTAKPLQEKLSGSLLEVRGRYTIWASTPASVAAAYARGSRLACGRLWLEWNAKKLAKSASPAAYQLLRRVRASGS
ncbi:MAG TPA: polysaccharide deacetylase family protein [Solirubrobacteraceae bacterium]|jgi:peptidoglycan/xylan/chitin deacetylase (PgdA/CDA1 family)|nr:polysaccharide deacetylase family protein [Solirubrobacteraceae bacterium]